MYYDNENQLENAIYFSKPGEMFRAGLSHFMHDHVLKQFDMGVYGVPDLVGLSFYEKTSTSSREVDITIYELKVGEINIDTIVQASKYRHGMYRFLVQNKNRFRHVVVSFKIVLVGYTIQNHQHFHYLADAARVSSYTYNLKSDNLTFQHYNHRNYDHMPWVADPYKELGTFNFESLYVDIYKKSAEARALSRREDRLNSGSLDEIDKLFERRSFEEEARFSSFSEAEIEEDDEEFWRNF